MRWMWIDRIVELVPGKKLVAVKHVSMAEEHLHAHFPARTWEGGHRSATPLMPMSLIIEGMAQTAGVLVGHAEGFREKVILAKVSKAEVTRDARPGDTLRYTAEVLQMDRAGASTKGTVELISPTSSGSSGEPVVIGGIDLMFSHIDNNMGGQEFPSWNFVFSDSFKTLLRTSGVAQV